MKLATFTEGGRTRVGVVAGDEIVDPMGRDHPIEMIELLKAGEDGLRAVRDAALRSKYRFGVSAVRIEAPVLSPRKFLGIGGSYKSHLAEVARLGINPPKFQTWFNKQTTCVNGPYDDIHLPRVSETLDYEGELAIIIGRRCRHLTLLTAQSAIAGYTVCNDVSVREWQMRAPTATLGKSFDTHGPIGPWLVTPDELPQINDLSLKTWVNGKLRQSGSTAELLYQFSEMLVELSTVFTLEPGDVLTTGCPAGVGGAMQPPCYLRVGDVCRVEVEGIGYIENRVIPEPGGVS